MAKIISFEDAVAAKEARRSEDKEAAIGQINEEIMKNIREDKSFTVPLAMSAEQWTDIKDEVAKEYEVVALTTGLLTLKKRA